MLDLTKLFDKLLEFLQSLLGYYETESGSQVVLYRFGRAVKALGEGPHWRPPLIYRFRNELFCGDQIEIASPDYQEVITKDCITCKIKSSLLYWVSNLLLMVTKAYDADNQLRTLLGSDLRTWAKKHSFNDCADAEPNLEMIPKTVAKAKEWGIEITALQITDFAPANPEAQALANCLQLAERRVQAAQITAETIQTTMKSCPGLDPSIAFAAIMGAPVSTLTPLEQLSDIRGSLKAVEKKLTPPELPDEDGAGQLAEAALSHLPGGQFVSQLASSLNEEG